MAESLVTVQFTDNRPVTPELQAWLDFCGEKVTELLQEQYRQLLLYGYTELRYPSSSGKE